MKDVVIASATRTPIGAFTGAFKDIPAPKLGATTLRATLEASGVKAEEVDECLMGCVLPAGMGQAPARQAALFAELPRSIACTTVNRVCGSGLKTVMLASQAIKTGDAQVVLAGGMESMSRAPYLIERAREGYRLGHGKILDSMITDGLWDVYNDYHMGNAAELCSSEKKFSRDEQDRFALQSYQRSLKSIEKGLFKDEIVPVEVSTRKGTHQVDTDEEPARGKLDKFSSLRPAFNKEGVVTAANASSLSDGAASMLLCSMDYAQSQNLKPLARIVAQASHAQEPEWFTTAPVGAMEKVLKKANLSAQDIDLFEINEAFACVSLAAIREFELDESKVNVRGGAISIGHPLGASGARILVTLLHALKSESKKYGLATLCIGGGEASAVVVENLA